MPGGRHATSLAPGAAKMFFGQLACIILVCTLDLSLLEAFQTSSTTSFRRPTSPLHAINEDSFDVEAVRKHLESLVGGGPAEEDPVRNRNKGGTVLTDLSLDLPPPPPLTTIERERRHAEMKLLADLADGDAAMKDLWNLWFNERGPRAAARLAEAEELTSEGPLSWPKAEEVLEELIEEYGVFFTEPVNRLATLYYLQDRLEESEKLCKIVLECKPWHFGALSGIVMVHAGLRNVNAARLWAARRLPMFALQSPNERRQAWVMRALQDAEQSLVDAEERVHLKFGDKDEHAPSGDTQSSSGDISSDDDTWQ